LKLFTDSGLVCSNVSCC